MAFEFGDLEWPGFFSLDVDSLVDDTLFNTCTLLDENCNSVVQVPKTEEKSPFHESDSGVSDIGDNRSPLWEKDIPMLDEMLENPLGPFLVGNGGSDDEYIAQHKELVDNGVVWSNEQIDRVPETSESVIDLQTTSKKTRSQSAVLGRQGEPKSNVCNRSHRTIRGSRFVNRSNKTNAATARKQHTDSVTSISEDENEIDIVNESTSRRKPKGSIQVKQAGEELPSNSNFDKCNVTSVKVLRVVKSSSDSNAEDDITKALEERNRKNAEMARQNRLKKKEYVGNLECEVEDGRKRIDELESALNDVEEERDSYKREVDYLKSVLANQSALAGLLKNIPNVSGVTLSSSVSRKRVAELDHSYTPMKKSRHEGVSTSSRSGVCLHVDSDNVSLEFCHHCADMAQAGPLS